MVAVPHRQTGVGWMLTGFVSYWQGIGAAS
jgi:hypothetical protein